MEILLWVLVARVIEWIVVAVVKTVREYRIARENYIRQILERQSQNNE